MDDDLFEMPAEVDVQFVKVGEQIPVILIDGIFKRPDEICEAALKVPYSPPPYPYPGKLAAIPEPNPSLSELRRKMLHLVNSQYLSRLPIARYGRRIPAFSSFTRISQSWMCILTSSAPLSAFRTRTRYLFSALSI